MPELGVVLLVLTLLVARLALLMSRGLRRRSDGWAVLSRRLDVVGVVLLAFGAINAVTSGTVEQTVRELPQGRSTLPAGPSVAQEAAGMPPDIVVLLLDGYPRADTLERLFAYDQRPFLRALEQRGFAVAGGSRSSYSLTPLTLSSMFNMAPLEEIETIRPLYDRFARQGDPFRRSIGDSAAIRLLRERGYRVVVSHSGFEQARIGSADVFPDDGELNEYEIVLLRRGVLLPLLGAAAPDVLPEMHRARLRSGLAHLVAGASTGGDRPLFLFVHVPSPHTPLVFAADGAPVPVDDLARFFDDSAKDRSISEDTFRARMRGQVEWLNRQVLEAIDAVLAASDRSRAIIVMSDHGTGSRYDRDDLSRVDVGERMSTLFAALTPGKPGLYPADVTTVDVFPYLFDAYLGTQLPRHGGRTFLSKVNAPFEYIEVPNPDRGTSVP